jgi:hypothetical protein
MEIMLRLRKFSSIKDCYEIVNTWFNRKMIIMKVGFMNLTRLCSEVLGRLEEVCLLGGKSSIRNEEKKSSI